MNLLIIVGNGFDLAHSLKTDYKSLLLWMTKRAIQAASKKIGHWNEYHMFSVKQLGYFRDNRLEEILNYKTIEEIKLDYSVSWEKSGSITPFVFLDGKFFGDDKPEKPIQIRLKGYLANKIFDSLFLNDWVDIERLYYESIIEILDHTESEVEEKIVQINGELESIKTCLIEYLKQVKSEFDLKDFIKKFPDRHRKLNELLINNPLRKPSLEGDSKSEVLFLNFNYTNLLEDYIHSFFGERNNFKVINIHGSLDDDLSKIVFGYGHIQNSEYHKIKESNISETRKNLKRDIYRVRGNDDDLNSFIDKSPFIVKILGHSCGVSDGSLLQRIFESTNCNRILISHRGEADFRSKFAAILRHSKNDDIVGNKVYKMIPSLMFPELD